MFCISHKYAAESARGHVNMWQARTTFGTAMRSIIDISTAQFTSSQDVSYALLGFVLELHVSTSPIAQNLSQFPVLVGHPWLA